MTENENTTPKFPLDMPMEISAFFTAPLDDVDDYMEKRMEIVRNSRPEGEKKKKLKISDALLRNEALDDAISALVESGTKYGASKNSNVLSIRVAFDLVDKKARMLVTEHLPWEAIYHTIAMGSVMRMFGGIAKRMGNGGFAGGTQMPDVGDMECISSEDLEGMPDDMKQQLKNALDALRKKLGD